MFKKSGQLAAKRVVKPNDDVVKLYVVLAAMDDAGTDFATNEDGSYKSVQVNQWTVPSNDIVEAVKLLEKLAGMNSAFNRWGIITDDDDNIVHTYPAGTGHVYQYLRRLGIISNSTVEDTTVQTTNLGRRFGRR